MRLTLHSDLALRALLFLAAAGENGGTIPQIAAAYRISENHLRKVAHELVTLGLIESVRGRSGGLRLRRPPSELSIGAILRLTEPDFALADCLGNTPERCVITDNCGLQRIFGEALNAWFAVLDGYTLADAVSGSRKLHNLLNIGGPSDTAPSRA
jgi:Rrf2 family transcriptional regulator, nitric oxide-sensitive transcriptional repressor